MWCECVVMGTRVCVRVCVSARGSVWVVGGGGVPLGVEGMEWVSSMAAWPRGTWRGRGSGGAHGRMDTWVGYVGREACMIT